MDVPRDEVSPRGSPASANSPPNPYVDDVQVQTADAYEARAAPPSPRMEEMQVRQGPPSPRNELSKEEIAELQAEVGDVVIIEDKSPRKRTDDLEGALPAGLPSTPLDGKCSSVGMYFAVIFVFLSWIFILAAASSEDWIVGDDDYKTGLRYTCHTTDNGQVCWELPDTDGTGMWSCNPRDVGNSVKGLMGFAAVFVTFSLILSVAVFLLHPNPFLKGAMCIPKGGIQPVRTWNPCKIHTLGAISIAVACSSLFAAFWVMCAFGHYMDCVKPDDAVQLDLSVNGTAINTATSPDWYGANPKYGDGVGCAICAWVMLIFASFFMLLYTFLNKERQPAIDVDTDSQARNEANPVAMERDERTSEALGPMIGDVDVPRQERERAFM